MNETIDGKVKVFISWSSAPSQEVARALRLGIRTVFDAVIPFVSDVDIVAGTRGLRVIEEALQGSSFGIIVVTPDNMKAPWLNFEAGALSKALTDAETRVVPLLVGISSATQLSGPLSQFQARTTSQSDIRNLFHTIGDVAGVERAIVDTRLAGWWPGFSDVVESVQSRPTDALPKRPSEDLLEELLDLVRSMRRESLAAAGRSTAAPHIADASTPAVDRAVARDIEQVLQNMEVRVKSVLPHADGFLVLLAGKETAEQLAHLRARFHHAGVKLVFVVPAVDEE